MKKAIYIIAAVVIAVSGLLSSCTDEQVVPSDGSGKTLEVPLPR